MDKLIVDAESFAAVTQTRPHVCETGPRASVPEAGSQIGQAGDQSIG
jgi:hypothetical protein